MKSQSINITIALLCHLLSLRVNSKTIELKTFPDKIENTYIDVMGMPRCIEGDRDSVLFFWDEKNYYIRDVYVITLSQLNSKSEFPADNCSHWQNIVKRKGIFGKKKLDINAKSFAGVDFDERTVAALTQLQSGASVYLSNYDVKDFVNTHKITKMDQELNRQLTRYYGHGFASLIYKQVLDSIPKNKIFLDRVSTYANSLKQSYSKSEIAERFKNRTAVFITGYMYDPVTNNRTKAISDYFTTHGIDFKQIVPKPMGSVRENAAYIAQELRTLLAMNKNLVLFAISKGVPEVFGALSELREEIDNPHSNSGGHIDGFVSLVGLTSGSIIVDAFDSFPMNLIAQYKLKQIVNDMNKKGGSLKFETSGFNDMKTKRMEAFYKEILPFPKNVTYINAIGISYSSQGIPRADQDMKAVQQELLRKVNPSSGANDAFVEFPYSEIPNEWVGANDKNNYQLVFDSPHNLMAGSILGYDLQNEADRPIILGAMFLAVLDAIDKRL